MNAHYPDLFERGPVAFVAISQSGIIKATNLTFSELLGTLSKDLTDRSISAYIHQEDFARFDSYSKTLFETGVTQTFEVRLVKANHQMIWAQIATVLMIEEVLPVAWIAIIDISSQKKNRS